MKIIENYYNTFPWGKLSEITHMTGKGASTQCLEIQNLTFGRGCIGYHPNIQLK